MVDRCVPVNLPAHGVSGARAIILALAISSGVAARGVAQATPTRSPAIKQLPDSVVQRIVLPHVSDSEDIERPVFIGPLGPSPRTILVLESISRRYGGFALADSAGRGPKLPLPMLTEFIPQTIKAVLFEPTPGDSAPMIIVIATYITGYGRNGLEEFYDNSVLHWNGSAFVELPNVEQRIAHLTTAAAVRRALRSPRGE